ncbi:MAG: hydantoinase/oxoprolinase family protein, partial [Planctomycetota bacterium]
MDMRLGTTRGTNALLERRGSPTALFITRGLADLVDIGDQQRPDLFALRIDKRRPLHDHVVEVPGRLAADGSIVEPLTSRELDELAERGRGLLEQGVRSAAVALLHSYRNPEQEEAVVGRLREVGFEHVSGSAQLAPLIKLLPRAETAIVDAYLGPVVHGYLDAVERALSGGRLLVMTSAGGLRPSTRYRAVDSLLSGPAGGVVGAAASGARAGCDHVIGFDMGGTSTDVCRYDGDYEYRYEFRVGDARLVAPALAIETVAAGGGSVCGVRDERLLVGPESAGADPGPACYGAGGPLTITDVNLLSGRLSADCFEIPLDPDHARTALDAVRSAIDDGAGQAPTGDELLDGFLQIANERMAGAIARVSIARGYDPSEYALVGFGGAGGQHACAVAGLLAIDTVILPRDASLLSAVGLRRAVLERLTERQVLRPLDEVRDDLDAWLDELGREAVAAVVEAGAAPQEVAVRRRVVHLRLTGQETTLPVEHESAAGLEEAFRRRYEAMYRHEPPGKPVEVESIRVVASTTAPAVEPCPPPRTPARPVALRTVPARFDGRWLDAPAYERSGLVPGDRIDGPALVLDRRTTFVVEPGWTAAVDGDGGMVCRRRPGAGAPAARTEAQSDLIRQELFTNRFQDLVEEAGRMLQRTAISTNVKERLDFSCALLDGDGRLVVNAPHIPVHLGAMGMCVRAVRERMAMESGDVVVTNHPGLGGTHLP